MEKKKVDLRTAAAEAGKSTLAFFGKARDSIVKAVDQNDDGSFDLKDVSIIAESIGNSTKNAAAAAKESAEMRSRELERKTLQPIFADDLVNADFLLSKLICIDEMDKKHSESEVCQGSIGFLSKQKDLTVVTIFRDKVDAFGLQFYPDADGGVYYVDPSDRDRYIALDDYFSYLKIARINELQKIAQDLGAKHFRVTYKEQKASFTKESAKAHSKVKAPAGAGTITGDISHDLSTSEASTVEVAAEMQCLGHAPMEPTLRYLQREPSIQTLVALRMDKNAPITHQKYTLKLSNSTGIKEKDAVKIDAALKAMKIQGNATVASEVKNESRRFFEYEIDF